MNSGRSPETRRKPIHVSEQSVTYVSGLYTMGALHPHPTAMDGGSAGFAGAKTCHAGGGLR